MKRSYAGHFALLAVLLCGCSESVRLKSSPPGASIYINEKAVGDTPVTFTTNPGANMHGPWQYRLEYKGTPVGSGEIETRVSRGRVTGTVFTAGILMLFRSPRVFISDEILFKFFPPGGSPPTYFSQPGTGSIAGQAFAVTRGDDVKPAAGRTVVLHPDCEAIREYYATPAAEDEKRAYTLVSPPPEDFTKATAPRMPVASSLRSSLPVAKRSPWKPTSPTQRRRAGCSTRRRRSSARSTFSSTMQVAGWRTRSPQRRATGSAARSRASPPRPSSGSSRWMRAAAPP